MWMVIYMDEGWQWQAFESETEAREVYDLEPQAVLAKVEDWKKVSLYFGIVTE